MYALCTNIEDTTGQPLSVILQARLFDEISLSESQNAQPLDVIAYKTSCSKLKQTVSEYFSLFRTSLEGTTACSLQGLCDRYNAVSLRADQIGVEGKSYKQVDECFTKSGDLRKLCDVVIPQRERCQLHLPKTRW